MLCLMSKALPLSPSPPAFVPETSHSVLVQYSSKMPGFTVHGSHFPIDPKFLSICKRVYRFSGKPLLADREGPYSPSYHTSPERVRACIMHAACMHNKQLTFTIPQNQPLVEVVSSFSAALGKSSLLDDSW